jgi:hypothetical protein
MCDVGHRLRYFHLWLALCLAILVGPEVSSVPISPQFGKRYCITIAAM